MAFQLLINAIDYTNALIESDVDVTEALQANGHSMDGTLFMKNLGLPDPEGGNLIEFFRDGNIEFRGRITEIEVEQVTGPYDLTYKVKCVDQTWDLDTKLILTKFPTSSLGDYFRAVIGIVGKAFTVNNVIDGPPIAESETDYDNASSLLSTAAEAVEHQWFVDYDRDIHLFYVADFQSPLPFGIHLENDTKTWFDAVVTENVDQVKNVLFLRGAKAKSGNGGNQPYIENFVGDGATRFFPLGYQPWSADADSVSVRIGTGYDGAGNPTGLGSPYTIKVDGVDGSAGDGSTAATTAFVCVDNQGVRLPDGIAAPGTPAAHVPVQVQYDYAYDAVVEVEDPDSIEEMRRREDTPLAPSDGRHEFVFQIPEIRVTTEDAIVDYGNLLLLRYAQPVVTVSFKSWVQGWAAGQSLTIKSGRFTLIGEAGRTFYIQTVKKSILVATENDTLLKYEIEASSSPFPSS